jgi:3'(2'), 5'-bisphosphate nucleotidase
VPKLGTVFAPATGRLHGGCVGEGAWLDEGEGRVPIRTRLRGEAAAAVASKSHLKQATIDYLEAAVGNCEYLSIGSSLKFCIVAEGQADIYPRASPTSEWDTAAGHAILLAAGGLVDGPDGTPLGYGKRAFLNRAFVATSGWKPPVLEPFLEPFSGGGELPAGI